MHVRTTTVRRGDKTYRYTRIQQSYRDGQGRPTNRTLASFSELPPVLEANLKAAIDAGRQGRAVVVADEVGAQLGNVAASLRYLDVAVALRLWRQWQLSDLIEQILPRGEPQVAVSQVVSALTIHRCVAPGSKLSAQRWYRRTALPELQGVEPSQLNNSRIHRALQALEQVEQPLQERLAADIGAGRGQFGALFLDISNAHFVGRGPEIAEKGRLKNGSYGRRIGIVLLCDGRGYPLRWKTLPGSYRETAEMESVVQEVAQLEWVQQVPLVLDRAMGQGQTVEFLANSDVRFVTAVPDNEMESHTDQIPTDELSEAKIACLERTRTEDLQRIARAAKRAGLHRIRDDRWVLDLGVLSKDKQSERSRRERQRGDGSRTAEALKLARQLRADRQQGNTVPELARRYDCGTTTVKRHLQLAGLSEPLQQRVLDGELDGATIGALAKIARRPEPEQVDAFEQLEQLEGGSERRRRRNWLEPEPPVELRYVVHFNPERFWDERRVAMEQQLELDTFIEDLNERLRSQRSQRTETHVRGEVDRRLRRMQMLSVFDVQVHQDEDGHHVVELHRDEEAWARRRRRDGINLVVAHPELDASAEQLVALYFAKDAVEKDFGTIKGELELRPIRHRTDDKVRAHVTLCMLALLLERTLEQQLRRAHVGQSAASAFETLADCRLNRLEAGAAILHTVTELTDEQRHLLDVLGLRELGDDETLRETIQPRS